MSPPVKTLPIKTLPIVERWDCTGCGLCCRGHLVPLDEDDLARLRRQGWERHPDYRGVRTVTRPGFFGGTKVLGQKDDGTCVFLTEDGLCRIHKEFGYDQKPLICRMYPLQLVPAGGAAYLTLRRSCPTAAEGKGRTTEEHRKDARRFARERPSLATSIEPPRITRRLARSWTDTLLVTDTFEKLLTDRRYPLVRRLVHGLAMARLLERCRLRRMDTAKLGELTELLRPAAIEESAEVFRSVTRPSGAAQALFRQVVLEYLRLHPLYAIRESWRERWKLMRASLAFAAGRGAIPSIHVDFPSARFDRMEEPMGHLDLSAQQPFIDYFESSAVSRQYAIACRPGWSIVEKFRALALAYPAALWMLRYFRGEQPVSSGDAIELVTTLERGQGFASLARRQHRRRVDTLASLDQLDRLVVWYAR